MALDPKRWGWGPEMSNCGRCNQCVRLVISSLQNEHLQSGLSYRDTDIDNPRSTSVERDTRSCTVNVRPEAIPLLEADEDVEMLLACIEYQGFNPGCPPEIYNIL